LGVAVLTSIIFYKFLLELRALRRFSKSLFLARRVVCYRPDFLVVDSFFAAAFRSCLFIFGYAISLVSMFCPNWLFSGGCCYGSPLEFGVRYPDSVFFPAVSPWRRFQARTLEGEFSMFNYWKVSGRLSSFPHWQHRCGRVI
jgi:hypothetical protein